LDTLIRLIAPFAPFLSEELYQLFSCDSSITNQESVHMCDWPRVEQKWVNFKLEEDVNVADKIVTGGLKARQKAKLKLRWPVASVYIVPSSDEIAESINRVYMLIKEQINSKELLILNSNSSPPECSQQASLNYKKAGTLFKRDVPHIDKALSNITVQTLKDNFTVNGYLELQLDSGKKVRLTPDLVNFSEQVPESLVTTEIKEAKIYIDTTRTPELLAESIAREIVRRAQIMRKEMDLRVDEFVELVIQVEEEETFDALQALTDYVKTEVRVKEIQLINPANTFDTKAFYTKIWEIERENIILSVRRI
jgi:isoleucyl-tRNA synthetase